MTNGWHLGTIRSRVDVGDRRLLVVKLGGSLLTRPRWPEELELLLSGLQRPLLLIVGGGTVVDGLRAIDAAAARPPAMMHRLAIEAMRLTGAIVAESLTLPVVTTAHDAHAAAILDVADWLATHAATTRLPENWTVTSDSLAAAVAAAVDADLLLIKSVPPPAAANDLQALSAAGWVDTAFPTAAHGVAGIEWAAPAP
jgi:aspartokinase-like uncharacterized kinase